MFIRKFFTYASLVLFSILGFFIFPEIFADSNDITSSGFTINPCELNPLSSNCSPLSQRGAIDFILTKFSELLLYFMPIIAGISFIVAGYYYILSSGDSEKASQAKTIIKWNIVAIFIAFFSFILIKLLVWIIT